MYVRTTNPVAASEKPKPSRHTRTKEDHSDESSADRVFGPDAVELTQFNDDQGQRREQEQPQQRKNTKEEADETPRELNIKA